MFSVHLFFLIGRATLKVEQASVWSDATPTIDHSRFVLIKYKSWSGETHQDAYNQATKWLKGLGSQVLGLPLSALALE